MRGVPKQNVSDHLSCRGKYKLCTGQLGGYYDKNGLRIACCVLDDEDEDGLPASEWKERYYPEGRLPPRLYHHRLT
jgi:hypothetical protein